MGNSNKKMIRKRGGGWGERTCEIEFSNQRNKKDASKGEKRSNQSFDMRRKQFCVRNRESRQIISKSQFQY